jgi:peptidoglycan/LPS O-acetylase OafA/YrhL
MKYRPEIDGLRAIAVIPVILFHAGYSLFSGGFVGVDVFFVISGYLITTIVINDIKKKQFSILGFYERRARRILPALYCIVILSLILAYLILMPHHLISFSKSAVSIPLFSSNFFFWSERGYFGAASELKPLIHTWSLAVEEQFYIIYPLVLAPLYSRNKKILYLLMAIILVISLMASFYVTRIHFETAFYLPFTRAWELLIGCFVAFYINRSRAVMGGRIFYELISIIGFILILYSFIKFDQTTMFPYLNAFIPTFGTALIILGTQQKNIVRSVLSYKPITFIGLISYSLYLVHQPIFVYARHTGVFVNQKILLIILSFILAIFSYKFIETPFRNKEVISLKHLVLATIGGTLVIFTISTIFYLYQGFPSRYNESDRKILVQLSEYPGYNQRLFDSLKLSSFPESDHKKVLLIGDSHAKDFLNVLNESNQLDFISVSTHQVNAECGNLYLSNYESLDQFIPDNRIERCKVLGRYEGERFLRIIEEADEIWLAAVWSEWVIRRLPESIKNLTRDFKKPVRIFGLKNFGQISEEMILKLAPNKRIGYTTSVTQKARLRDNLMQELLSGYDDYYPMLDIMCGGDGEKCKIFDNNGLMISPDGGHITKEGAIELGSRIKPLIDSLVN